MKAMGQKRWAPGEPLQLLELPDPTPKPNEVRVRVQAIGVNPVDWKMRQGGPLRLAIRLIGPGLPFVPGIDFAGVVDAVGGEIKTVKVGDRVVGGTDFSKGQRGSYADTVVVREDALAVLPDAVDFESAGGMPVAGVTAWMSLVEIGGLATRGAGASVLVLGAAGGVGQFSVQIGKMHGATVVGVCSGKNAELVRGLGADVVLDYTSSDPLVQAKAHAPFDIVVDCVGTYSGAACRALLKPGGRHVIVSGEGVGAVLQTLVPPFSSKQVLGRSTTARLSAIVAGMAAGKIKVAIALRLPLTEAEAAHAQSQGGRMTGKIILKP